MNRIFQLKNKLFSSSLIFKIIFILIFLVLGWFLFSKIGRSKSQPQYQTALVEKGTLISSVSASGIISVANSKDIVTRASGTVKEVFVKNGQKVVKGQKLATLSLDDEGLSRQAVAWAAYIEAVNAQKTAEKNKITTDIEMWKAREAIFDALDDQEYKNNHSINPTTKEEYSDSEKAIIDKTVEEARKAFEAAETTYKNFDAQIEKAKAQVTLAWKNYEQSSAVITAPASGILNNFSLVPGMVLVPSTTVSSSETNTNLTSSSLKVGSVISENAQYQAVVNLSEVDVVRVKPDQKVTLTLDAFPQMTFTGKVLAIDTAGKVSSGVTTYPTTILLDPTSVEIYPNMSVTANIIVEMKNDVLLVPNSAIQSRNNETFLRVLKDGKIQEIPVEVGLSSQTQTEILSGVEEGTEVITATISSQSTTFGRSSPFGIMRMGTGGQQIRINR